MGRTKHPTYTLQVLEYLRGLDDFATAPQIKSEIGLNTNQVHAALHLLRNHHAADCLGERGELYWYARPAEDDNRRRVVNEIVDGITRRRKRKPG